MLGTVSVGWRPESWNLKNDPYAGKAGWSVATFSGATLVWWVSAGATKAWKWVTVPLWLPTLVFALPTALFWYRDRRIVRENFRRAIDWLRPECRQKVTIRCVLAWIAIHTTIVIAALFLVTTIFPSFFIQRPSQFADPCDWLIGWIAPILFLGAPAWGSLWAYLYVRMRNHLLETGPRYRCLTCGYDLTGNVSGVCPECGEPVGREKQHRGP
jgi:hypothetical protein